MSAARPYNDEVRKRFEHPVHAGDLEGDYDRVLQSDVSESQRGARLVLSAGLRDGKIAALRFRAKGCPHLIAAADLFCSEFEGAEPLQLAEVRASNLCETLEVPVAKTGRILLIEDAAMDLIEKDGGQLPGN